MMLAPSEAPEQLSKEKAGVPMPFWKCQLRGSRHPVKSALENPRCLHKRSTSATVWEPEIISKSVSEGIEGSKCWFLVLEGLLRQEYGEAGTDLALSPRTY